MHNDPIRPDGPTARGCAVTRLSPTDAALDAFVVPGFSRIGLTARTRLSRGRFLSSRDSDG